MSLDDLAYTNAPGKVTNVYLNANSVIGSHWAGVTTGTNTIVGTMTPAPSAYAAGMLVFFKAGGSNSGATTANINSLGAVAVQIKGAALAGGEIDANGCYGLLHDGSVFNLIQVS